MSIAEPPDAAKLIRLWPDGAPSVITGVGDEIEFAGPPGVAEGTAMLRNISDPSLTVFTPPAGTSNGVGVIVAPGGGWTINAWTHEGLDVARWLSSVGYTAFLLKYRVQASDPDQAAYEARELATKTLGEKAIAARKFPASIGAVVSTPEYLAARAAAAEDGRRAIELTREHAASFGVDPNTIGMLGFSAGAFLAVDVALDPRAEQLGFVVAIYGGETCGAAVPDDAPPLFTVVARDDILWKICEGLHRDWCDAGKSAEQHVFARGAHGFGMARQNLPADQWTELCLAWLEDIGFGGREDAV